MPISTKTTIEIDGETLSRFSNLTIHQKVNEHHTFTIEIPMPREVINQGIEKAQSYIGQEIRITIEPNLHKNESSFLFYGIVTQAKVERTNGAGGKIIINGSSNTILLDASKSTRSFTNKLISEIVNEVGGSRNTISSNVQNNATSIYTVQYNETDFDFLCRMAQKKGEWFFYDGAKLYFGKPNSKSFNLIYGTNLDYFNIEMNAKPLGIEFIGYDPSAAETQKANSQEINPSTTGYTKSVFDSSKKVYLTLTPHYTTTPLRNRAQEPILLIE